MQRNVFQLPVSVAQNKLLGAGFHVVRADRPSTFNGFPNLAVEISRSVQSGACLAADIRIAL
jgi:hypothetical protein